MLSIVQVQLFNNHTLDPPKAYAVSFCDPQFEHMETEVQ